MVDLGLFDKLFPLARAHLAPKQEQFGQLLVFAV